MASPIVRLISADNGGGHVIIFQSSIQNLSDRRGLKFKKGYLFFVKIYKGVAFKLTNLKNVIKKIRPVLTGQYKMTSLVTLILGAFSFNSAHLEKI